VLQQSLKRAESLCAWACNGELAGEAKPAQCDAFVPAGMAKKAWYCLWSVHRSLSAGRVEAAERLVRRGLALAKQSGHAHLNAVLNLGRALVSPCLQSGSYLRQALVFCRESRSCWLLFSYLCASAYDDLNRGRKAEASEALCEAMKLGKLYGFGNCWFWNHRVMLRLCIFCLQNGIESSFVKQLVKRRNLYSEDVPLVLEAWPWPIKIFTLGRFEAVTAGEPLNLSSRGVRKPLELLKAIIAKGGTNVSKHTVLRMLWPDMNQRASENSLSITLHRLRNLLGNKESVVLAKGRLSLNRSLCWVDLLLLEERLGHCEALVPALSDDSSAVHFEIEVDRLLESAARPFLPDEDQPWVLSERARVSGRLLKLTTVLGRRYESGFRYAEALRCYCRALPLDPFNKGLHADLARCLEKLNSCAETAPQYGAKPVIGELKNYFPEDLLAVYPSLKYLIADFVEGM